MEESKSKKEKETKEKKDILREEQDDDYGKKAEKAIDKLKEIANMMSDF